MATKEEKACINPIEDQRKQALLHYEEASSAIHHWSSFVENAIKSYNPEKDKEIAELKAKPHGSCKLCGEDFDRHEMNCAGFGA